METEQRKLRETQWQTAADEFIKMMEKYGYPIDEGVFEVVIGLNIFGIKTEMSCEGHLDHGAPSPWIRIEEAVKEDDMRMKRHKEASDKIMNFRQGLAVKQRSLTEEDEDTLGQLEQVLRDVSLGIKRENLEPVKGLMEMLDEFYQDRPVSYDKRLVLTMNTPIGNFISLINQGYNFQEVASPEVKQQKLAEYQQEMQDFGRFLKAKFLES